MLDINSPCRKESLSLHYRSAKMQLQLVGVGVVDVNGVNFKEADTFEVTDSITLIDNVSNIDTFPDSILSTLYRIIQPKY